MPSVYRKALNYLDEQTKWVLAGRPVVTDEVRVYRRVQCDSCDKRDKTKDECTLCGCPLHRTALGDKLSMATAKCPLPEPRWLATYRAEEGPTIEDPIPSWRQVITWIDAQAKPTYIDGLTLRPDDVVVQDAWLTKDEIGSGFSVKWDHIKNLIPTDFTGRLPLVVGWDYFKSQVTGRERIEIKKGSVRFEGGKPVEVSCP